MFNLDAMSTPALSKEVGTLMRTLSPSALSTGADCDWDLGHQCWIGFDSVVIAFTASDAGIGVLNA